MNIFLINTSKYVISMNISLVNSYFLSVWYEYEKIYYIKLISFKNVLLNLNISFKVAFNIKKKVLNNFNIKNLLRELYKVFLKSIETNIYY